MITKQDMARAFAFDIRTIKQQVQGLNHPDSILQPPVQGNCLNWVLGHCLETRNNVLQLLGASTFLTEAQAKRYGYGSEPVCNDGDDVLKLDQMLALFDQSQAALETALSNATDEQLNKEMETFLGKTSVGYFVFFLYRHEAYHLGQTEILRELALANK